MTMLMTGLVVCDGCGADLRNGATMYAARVFVLTDVAGQSAALHLGYDCCLILTDLINNGMVWRQTSLDSPGPVTLYEPTLAEQNHPDTVTIHQVREDQP